MWICRSDLKIMWQEGREPAIFCELHYFCVLCQLWCTMHFFTVLCFFFKFEKKKSSKVYFSEWDHQVIEQGHHPLSQVLWKDIPKWLHRFALQSFAIQPCPSVLSENSHSLIFTPKFRIVQFLTWAICYFLNILFLLLCS